MSPADSSEFAALSYVWDEERKSEEEGPRFSVHCGENEIEVTPNCVDALRTIGRNMVVSVSRLTLYASTKQMYKRNHQGGIMDEIYSHPHTVYVWLENGTPKRARGIQLLRTVANKRLYLLGLVFVHSPHQFSPDVVGNS